jgi:hypothetical protein
MTQGVCASHSDRVAVYRCDGCQKLLCDDCVEESYKLLLCSLCGERALPLAEGVAASVPERQQQAKIARASTYSLKQALFYPFRGTGLLMFVAALISLAVVGFVLRFGIGCLPLILWVGWLTLLAGIQFKIARTTAEGDDEVPGWPEYFSFGERIVDFLTWMFIVVGLQYGPVVSFLFYFGARGLLTSEPSLVFWLGAAACLWLGTALALMGFGSASAHWRHSALRVDQHVRGLLATGGDALKFTNISFVMLGLTFVLKGLLDDLPVLGSAIAGTLGLYWAFMEPHFAGLIFRRNGKTLHAIYEG